MFFKPYFLLFSTAEMAHARASFLNSREFLGSQKFNEWLNLYELDFIGSFLPFQWAMSSAQVYTAQTYYQLHKK